MSSSLSVSAENLSNEAVSLDTLLKIMKTPYTPLECNVSSSLTLNQVEKKTEQTHCSTLNVTTYCREVKEIERNSHTQFVQNAMTNSIALLLKLQ